MKIRLNGNEYDVAANVRLPDVVALLTASDAGCAIAVNDEVVPRHEWTTRGIADGDRIEVLTAVQGG